MLKIAIAVSFVLVAAAAVACSSSSSNGGGGGAAPQNYPTSPNGDVCYPNESIAGCPCGTNVSSGEPLNGQFGCAQADNGTSYNVLVCGQPAGDGGAGYALNTSAQWIQVFMCPGNEQCSPTNGNDAVGCGETTTSNYITYAIAGAPCVNESSASCSFDLKEVLQCHAGKWGGLKSCPGATCGTMGNVTNCL
jgi:hypothetical protein